MDQARTEHREFGSLFDPNEQLPLRRGTRAPKLKKLVSQILLEAIRIDRDMGMYMFDMYNKDGCPLQVGRAKCLSSSPWRNTKPTEGMISASGIHPPMSIAHIWIHYQLT